VQAARIYQQLNYQTRDSWSRARRVVAKAEYLKRGFNQGFVVISLLPSQWAVQALYAELHCARGEMENRIKERLMLFSDRTNTAYLRSNQIRVYFSSVAFHLQLVLLRDGVRAAYLLFLHLLYARILCSCPMHRKIPEMGNFIDDSGSFN